MHFKTYKTKTFWSGLGMILPRIGLLVVGDVPEGFQTIAGGLVTICVRDAITKVGEAAPTDKTATQS